MYTNIPHSKATQIQRMIGATLAVIVTTLVLSPASALGQPPDENVRGCGVLVDAAHPWHSTVPGGNLETGDHWITGREGSLSTCSFTRLAIHRLLALPANAYQGRDVGHLLGGLCEWFEGSHHERIRPFALIKCHLPTPQRPHTAVTIRAFVDPDPQLIH